MTQTQVTETEVRGAEVDMTTIKDRFGGGDVIAALVGMFVGLGVLVFLGALLAAGGASIDYQLNAIDIDGNLQEIEVVGAIVAIAVVFASFLAGGYAAGRTARYEGGVNGLSASLLFVLLVAAFGALGTWVGVEYNAFAAADLPNWFAQFDAQDVTLKAVAAAAAAIVASLLGGYIGGVLGEQYHRDADATLVQETVDQVA